MSTSHSLLSTVLVALVGTTAALTQTANVDLSRHASRQVSYHLKNSYTSSNFFSEFEFFGEPDPTHGFVSYQVEGPARKAGLVNTKNNKIYMGVDYTTVNPPAPGRASVRLTSKKAFTHGLFIADIAHIPASACGTWPAFWVFGPNWPNSGEVDIIEGVHLSQTNEITLHTSPGCTVNSWGSQAGTNLTTSDCNTMNAAIGCSATTKAPFGDSFNAVGGGVYAMQWESWGIYIWFWPRSAIPQDVQKGKPNPMTWGSPTVAFNGGNGCNIDQFFQNQNIVFDTTFCGDWAGGVWTTSTCASKADTCQDYVSANPSAFKNSFWSVNSVKVYQV